MRRFIKYLRDYALGLVHGVGSGWSEFWFTPRDPTVLGLIRVLTGSMLIYTHAVWGLELDAFFGPHGWTDEAAMSTLQQGQFVFSYLWYVPPEWLDAAHWAALLVFVLFTLGCLTRLTSILSFFVLINYAHRAPAALFGLDQINALLTLYCAIGPSGAALSVDRLLARYRLARQTLARGKAHKLDLTPPPSTGANIAVRLIQLHMCVIYLFAGLSKMLGPAWWDGTAIWRAAASYEYQSADLTWMAHVPFLADLFTHLTAFWELTYCVLVWPRLTRPLVLAGAVLLHGGIGIFMGMKTFGLIMIVANISFVSPAIVRELAGPLIGARRPLTVVFDGACGLCQRAMSWVKALDAANRIRLVDFNRTDPATIHPSLTYDACASAMQVIDGAAEGARTFAGYWAFQMLVKRLRLLWPIAALLLVPGAGAVGRRLYRVIAANRARRLGCPASACAVHFAGAAATAPAARAPLHLIVKLPPDAELYIRDQRIAASGSVRTFTSKPARFGKDYVFDLRVELRRDGLELTMSQQVCLRAGQRSVVEFSLAPAGEKSPEAAAPAGAAGTAASDSNGELTIPEPGELSADRRSDSPDNGAHGDKPGGLRAAGIVPAVEGEEGTNVAEAEEQGQLWSVHQAEDEPAD